MSLFASLIWGNQSLGGLDKCLDSVTNHSNFGQPGWREREREKTKDHRKGSRGIREPVRICHLTWCDYPDAINDHSSLMRLGLRSKWHPIPYRGHYPVLWGFHSQPSTQPWLRFSIYAKRIALNPLSGVMLLFIQPLLKSRHKALNHTEPSRSRSLCSLQPSFSSHYPIFLSLFPPLSPSISLPVWLLSTQWAILYAGSSVYYSKPPLLFNPITLLPACLSFHSNKSLHLFLEESNKNHWSPGETQNRFDISV